MKTCNVTGEIPNIINNTEGWYPGDLRHYFQVHMNGPHICNPYHGLRHPLHVLWVAYQIGKRYVMTGQMTHPQFRALLIAALMHDYDHSGKSGNDSENIARAIVGMNKHVLREDVGQLHLMTAIIRSTEFPHDDLSANATLMEKIIRDADVGQAFSDAWMQTILVDLGKEMGNTPLEMLRMQPMFLRTIHIHTNYAKEFYGPNAIEDKCAEAYSLLEIWQGE